VIESKLDRGRGPVATILVQDGTLRVGDTFIAGRGWARARAHRRSRPANQIGTTVHNRWRSWPQVPAAGHAFQALADAAKARRLPPTARDWRRRSRWAPGQPAHAGVAASADAKAT